MVIVEGPDGAGKTTLIQHIYEGWEGKFEIQPRAVSAEAKSVIPIGPYIEGELAKGFGPRLYDRFGLISSQMYIELPDRTFREEMLDFEWLTMQNVRMATIDPVVIYCLPPLHVVKKNVAADESSKWIPENKIENIYWHYHAFAARNYSTSQMIWDYTKPDQLRIASLLRWADARTNDLQRRQRKWKTI